jgi:hypothetical protein
MDDWMRSLGIRGQLFSQFSATRQIALCEIDGGKKKTKEHDEQRPYYTILLVVHVLDAINQHPKDEDRQPDTQGRP